MMFFLPGVLKAGDDPLRKSLVKIFTTIQNPNYYEPWRVDAQQEVFGSGCIIKGHRILTNAHVISNQISIKVLKDGDTKKYTAKKEFVAHDCDLAVLKVDDPDFFKGTKPVTFGEVPFLRDKVQVYGYPVGGEDLSITEGVVSRVEIIPYAHSDKRLLGVQTDAAVNPGNSGGPAFKNRRLVGVVFEGYYAVDTQNISFFIPVPVINRFLGEIKKGGYRNVPALGLFTESLENDSLRSYLGMKSRQTGILITHVVYKSSAWDKLQENDVLTGIDGYPVANDKTIPFRKNERLHYTYPLCLRRIGDKIKIKILRHGKPKTISLVLNEENKLIPDIQYDISPTYFIFDGLVFTPLNENYIRTIKDPPPQFLALKNELPSENQKQIVLLSHILTHEINKGYDAQYSNIIVRKVNGVHVSEMKDLIKAFEKPIARNHIVEVENPEHVINKMIFDAEKSKQSTVEIMSLYHISSDRSLDLK
jgi:S1-C subfamily serine protease